MPLDSSEARRRRQAGTSLGQLGMVLVLVSLTVLFAAACIAVLITSRQVQVWRAPERSGLPWGMLVSTLVLGGVSWQLQGALDAIRNNRFTESVRQWRRAGVGVLVFLLAQALNARYLTTLEGELASRSLFIFCYDLLVGLHALHVIGGCVPLAIVHSKLERRDYSSSRHDGLTFCVQYWHYLGVVWLVLLATLLWVG